MPAKEAARRIGVLFSGGLDSAALLCHLLKQQFRVHPIYVRCGLRWENQEIRWAQRFLKALPSSRVHSLKTLHLPLDDAYRNNWSATGKTPGQRTRDEAVFLPARNLLLISKCLLYLSSRGVFQVAIGTLRGNPFPDGQLKYFAQLEKILSLSFQRRVRILAPFKKFTKQQVIRDGENCPIELSLSCISPKGITHCGRCNKCAERRKAFKRAGVEDKTEYRSS